MAEPRTITTILFPGFELLDVCGPLELFGSLDEQFRLSLAGPGLAPVTSTQGPALQPDTDYASAPPPDIVLVPGGYGTRALIKDRDILDWLRLWAENAQLVTSVCTGSAVLAAAGLLDGYRATSNKRAFGWVREQGRDVTWVPRARWVADRDRWTSSGVAAGLDMALALIAHLHGRDLAQTLADNIELEWHSDPDWDPFATLYGLDEP